MIPTEISRRKMLQAAGAAGLLVNSGALWSKSLRDVLGDGSVAAAQDAGARPRPIPTSFFSFGNEFGYHIYPPSRAYPIYGSRYFEPSTIYDFKGQVATLDVMAKGIETDAVTGQTRVVDTRALFRTMDGVYIGTDGKEHEEVWTFI